MKDQPNLYMEICGMLSNTLSIEDLVSLAGEDRVIYGSDMINIDVRYDFGRVIFSSLPDNIKKKIFTLFMIIILLAKFFPKSVY